MHTSNRPKFKGYVFKIMSISNKQGFLMKQGVLNIGRVRHTLHTACGASRAMVVARPGGIPHVFSLSHLSHEKKDMGGRAYDERGGGGARARGAGRGSLERCSVEHRHERSDAA